MDEYFIGAGALLTAGENASITAASLHAQPRDGLALKIRAAVVDFEANQATELTRILIVASGWGGGRFKAEVGARLLSSKECTLVDVIAILGKACETDEVHLFAHWEPDTQTRQALSALGITIVAHPLEAIGQAALICGQRMGRWHSPGRAA